jgi:hypothetical protein
MTSTVSGPSAEHLRRLASGLGAVLTGRRTFDVAQGWGQEITRGASVRRYPSHPRRMAATQLDVHFVTDGIESAVIQAKVAAGKSVGPTALTPSTNA